MNTMKLPRQGGFTLIELMITVAIIGILAAIAYPSYTAHVEKSRRADAKVALNELVQRQESYFLRNFSYASTLAQLGYAGTDSPDGHYTLAIASVTPSACAGTNASRCSAYTLSAVPKVGGVQVHDSKCASFTIDNRGTTAAKDSANNAAAHCW